MTPRVPNRLPPEQREWSEQWDRDREDAKHASKVPLLSWIGLCGLSVGIYYLGWMLFHG